MTRETKQTNALWARLAVGYFRDEKILEAGPVAELAYVRLLALAREVVESASVDGAVPTALARRELRDVTDLHTATTGGDFAALLAVLDGVGLIEVGEREIVITGYATWQTTRTEIEAVRAETRARVAAARARKKEQA